MTQEKPVFRPVPAGVIEVVGYPADGSILAASDGSLVLIQGGGVHESARNKPAQQISTDGGETWSHPEPVDSEIGAGGVIRLLSGALAMYGTKGKERGACYFCKSKNEGQTWSPPVEIPTTRDLLCIWNQVSAEEIRRGHHRGRLSAAISTDSGSTWKNFKTLELMEGMEDTARIGPDVPIAREVKSRPGLGRLPDGFAMFTYANVDIVGEMVFIRYSRQWPVIREGKGPAPDPNEMQISNKLHDERGADMKGEGVMRRYPLEYFYTE